MAVHDPAFTERCKKLSTQLGDDPTATRAARALVRHLGLEDLDQVRRHYEEKGPVVFAYEIRDLRGIGEGSAQRITEKVMELEPTA